MGYRSVTDERNERRQEAATLLSERISEIKEGAVNPRILLIRRTATKDVDEYRAETRTAIAARKLRSAGSRVHPGERINYLLSDVRDNGKPSRVAIEGAMEGSSYDASKYIKLLQAAADEVLFSKSSSFSDKDF